MTRISKCTLMLSAPVLLTIALAGTISNVLPLPAAAAAEKVKITYKKERPSEVVSETKVNAGDADGHTLTVGVRFNDSASNNLGSFRQQLYGLDDSVHGSGMHRGAYVNTFEDGSTTHGTYVGTTKTTVDSDGSWESTWEGTWQDTGGTGRFANAKGHGKYWGKMTPDSFMEEGEGELEY